MSKLKMPAHGNNKYPWAKWEDGKVHRVHCGRGRKCQVKLTPQSFRNSLNVRAARRQVRVTTSISNNVVTFQFVKPEEEAA